MIALNQNVQVNCGNCGTSVTKKHLFRHKSSCSGRAMYCPKCPKLFTKSRDDLNYQVAKKHSAEGPKNNRMFKKCCIEFPSFHSLIYHKQRYHTAETTSSGDKIEKQSLVDAGDDKRLEEELQSCRHSLVVSEIQKGDITCSILLSTNLHLRLLKVNGSRSGQTKVCSEA